MTALLLFDLDAAAFLPLVFSAFPPFFLASLADTFLPLDLSADLLVDLALFPFDSLVFFSSFLPFDLDSLGSLVLGFLASSAFYFCL